MLIFGSMNTGKIRKKKYLNRIEMKKQRGNSLLFMDKLKLKVIFGTIFEYKKNVHALLGKGSMLIEFRNVNKYYGNFQVLKNINVQVKKGEVVVVVGLQDQEKYIASMYKSIRGNYRWRINCTKYRGTQ